MSIAKSVSIAAAALATLVLAADPASAKCTRLAFSVNDYGKEGPIRDAKALLDKYIATWTGERGIKNYNVGKKDVTCELFLDFGVFDEHTCKAAATVCWPDGQKGIQTTAPVDGAAPKPAKKKISDSGANSTTTGSVTPRPAAKAN